MSLSTLFMERGDKELTLSRFSSSSLTPRSPFLVPAPLFAGLTFDDIGKAIGRDEVWVASVFYGQAKPLKEDIAKLAKVLGLPQTVRSLPLYPPPSS